MDQKNVESKDGTANNLNCSESHDHETTDPSSLLLPRNQNDLFRELLADIYNANIKNSPTLVSDPTLGTLPSTENDIFVTSDDENPITDTTSPIVQSPCQDAAIPEETDSYQSNPETTMSTSTVDAQTSNVVYNDIVIDSSEHSTDESTVQIVSYFPINLFSHQIAQTITQPPSALFDQDTQVLPHRESVNEKARNKSQNPVHQNDYSDQSGGPFPLVVLNSINALPVAFHLPLFESTQDIVQTTFLPAISNPRQQTFYEPDVTKNRHKNDPKSTKQAAVTETKNKKKQQFRVNAIVKCGFSLTDIKKLPRAFGMYPAEGPCAACSKDVCCKTVRVLPCQHMFHHMCVVTHLLIMNTCPNCGTALYFENGKFYARIKNKG